VLVAERPSRIVKRTVETKSFAGIPLVSTVVEEFEFDDYPDNVRKSLQKSTVPPELYADSLAVIGRAYGRVVSNWTSEKVGDTPDLVWRVPSPKDFGQCVDNLRESVGPDALVGLSDRLFGKSDTFPELYLSMRNEIDLIFNPPEKDR